MKSFCDKYATDIVCLKKPTALDKLADTIPKPEGAIPNFGLPKWKVMPLESKIPMVPGPEGAYNFTRRKIGKRLWMSFPDSEFNLNDPYCYEMKWNYDPLHDKHLIPFFSKPENIRRLIKVGVIAENLDVKCSLQDYNMYRKYLRKLHCDSVKKELRRRSRLADEERALQFAENEAEKEVKKLLQREKLLEASKEIIEKRKLAEKLKLQRQKEKQRMVEEKVERLALEKRENQRLLNARQRARAEEIKQKRRAAADIERRKIIKTLLDWSRKERIRKKTREVRLAREREGKKTIIEEKWKIRQEFQKKQIEKEQLLLGCVDRQREQFIKEYNTKINEEKKRMERQLENMKKFIRCYMARRLPGSKERICCKEYLNTEIDEEKSKIRKPPCPPKSYSDTIKYKKSSANNRMIKKERIDKKLWGVKHTAKRKFGIKKSRKSRRKKQKKQKKESTTELEDEQLDVMQETASAAQGTETSETSQPESALKDKCRCKRIKDAKQAASKQTVAALLKQ